MKLWLLTLAFVPLGVLQAQTPAPEPASTSKPGFAPLDYFQANCERCHGPNGSFYGPTFGKNLKSDAALRQIVKEMCEGPGNAPLPDPELEILTDFHRALRNNKPYITVVSREKAVLSGEATPDAKITLESGEKVVAAKLEGHKWSVEVPADFDLSSAKLRAVKGEVETVVELTKAAG
ncbi:MAG TPA: cytochrome c [Abditibacterium sp.]|jgi:hypothetical protein